MELGLKQTTEEYEGKEIQLFLFGSSIEVHSMCVDIQQTELFVSVFVLQI